MTPPSPPADGLSLAGFVHCPRCASASLSGDGEKAILCAACGFKFYFNCAAAVGALLLHQGKLVLGVRGTEPQKGMWDIPGGFIEYGETAEEALCREVLEELNLKVGWPVYLTSAPNDYPYAGIQYKTLDLYFVCELDDIAPIRAGDDVTDYVLVAPSEIDPQRLAFSSAKVALRKLLERAQA